MLALLAFICFLLDLFNVRIGTVKLLTLGFCFIALHLMFGGVPITDTVARVRGRST